MTLRPRGLLVVAALLSSLPMAALARKSPTPGGAEAQAAVAADGGATVAAPDVLLAAADDITRQVVALRGLAALRPVAKGVLSRQAIGAKLKERIAKEYTPGELRLESRVLKRLGLLPPDSDYEQLLADLFMEQVAGFYDPFTQKLYIADWLGLDLQRPALAHEIEHAIQDQHFNLRGFASPIKDDGDRQLARSALVEGDGTVVMLEFVAQQLGIEVGRLPEVVESLGKQMAGGSLQDSPVFDHAPRFLRETLVFPYFSGLSFVLALRKNHPWTRIDEVWKSPPESTEQVLHPSKYLAHEHPVPIVPVTPPSLSPRKELRRDVLGELELRVLFSSKISEGTAERAAEGWGGDRLVAYGDEAGDKPLALIDLSVWDTEDDAKEAEQAFALLLARQTGHPDPQARSSRAAAKTSASPSTAIADAGGADAGISGEEATAATRRDLSELEVGGEIYSVERRGKEVLTFFGVPSDRRSATAAEVFGTWKVGK